MWKKVAARGFISMSITCFITQVFHFLLEVIIKEPEFVPLVPDFQARFSSDALAVSCSVILTGLIGGGFGAASVIYEIERWSFLKQGIVHFLMTAAVWGPISIYLWGLGRYLSTFVSVFISFALTYGVIWGIQYCRCRENIRRINEKLVQLDQRQQMIREAEKRQK